MMLPKKSGPTASIEENGVEKKFAPSTLIPNLWGEALGDSESSPTFTSLVFLTVATAGPETWYSHHEYINGDNHRSVFDNSTGNPVNFRP